MTTRFAEHPDRAVVGRFLRGGASPSETRVLVQHLLAGCAECRQTVGDDRWRQVPARPSARPRATESPALPANVVPFRRRPAERTDYRRVFDRVAERLTPRQRDHADERHEVPALLSRLTAISGADRPAAVQTEPAFHRWAFVEALIEDSRVAGFSEPGQALDLAELAVTAAERLDGARYPAAAIADLTARAWAASGNALRILGRFGESARAFERALGFLDLGTGDPAERSRLSMMIATLRARQGRLDEAGELLDRALRLAMCCGDRHLQGSALVRRSRLAQRAGDSDRALDLLDRALVLIDPETDARLLLTARHNDLLLLVESGRYREALDRLEVTRELHQRAGGQLDLQRFRWLEGRLYAGLGWHRQASGQLEEVRRAFITAGLAYDAALVSLDLAALLAAEGRTREVRVLAEEIWPIFRSREAEQEAIAALLVFRDAALREAATARLIQEVADALRRARGDSARTPRSLDGCD